MTVVVATIQRGRRRHLDRQRAALALSSVEPSAHVVVSMDERAPTLDGCDVVGLPVAPGDPLPLAAARNRALERAGEAHGAELVVFLDVDCLPSPDLLARYREAMGERPGALLAGAVRYLPPGVPARGPLPGAAELAATPPHAARPAPAAGVLLDEPRPELFWSLSFAVEPATHRRLGGFDEVYVGYGAEDTDLGFRARRAGVPFVWVGGAEAYHQHHPVSSPPVEHLDDIVRNARAFRERWGTWPMEGWLTAFRERGLIRWDPHGEELSIASAVARATAPVAT